MVTKRNSLGGANSNFSPGIDAGYGLIYRLNYLWSKADRHALEGDMDNWNFTLDAIFRNLSYRSEMNVEYENPRERDENKRIITSVDLNNKEKMVHTKFKEMIKDLKIKKLLAIKNKNRMAYNMAKEEEYDLLMKKDIWLRKYMQGLKLYMKETEFDASNAMWGG